MQQHLMQMQPMMAYYPNNATTDHIQQYLDENKTLILKIVESQNLGKMSECAENQARLQRNLMYLAAIADSQPQPPAMQAQAYPSSSGMAQPGAHYMQLQTPQMTPQSLMAARSSMLYSQQPFTALQQQSLHNQIGMTSGGSTGLNMLQSDANNAGVNSQLGGGGFLDFGRGSGVEGLHRGMATNSMIKQDFGSGGSAEDRGGSSGSHGGGGGGGGDGGETLYLKASHNRN